MGDDRQITDCEHYMRGNCRWGYDCLFRHPTTLHEPQVLCKFWQQYSCTNKFCQFLHPAVLPEVESVPTHHSGPPVQTGEPKSKSTVCAYYMSGRCSKPSCPFLHSLPEPVSSRHPQQSSSSAQGQGQKRQAPDVLSKYSLKHSIEEKVAAALQSEKRFLDLDKKLESYQNAGLNNKNKETSNGEKVV